MQWCSDIAVCPAQVSAAVGTPVEQDGRRLGFRSDQAQCDLTALLGWAAEHGVELTDIMLAGYSSLLIAITTERERGMLKRLRGTPMPSWIFLAGEIMRTVVVVAVTVAVLVAVGAGGYRSSP